MRLLLSTALLAVTLFLGGCVWVPKKTPIQAPTQNQTLTQTGSEQRSRIVTSTVDDNKIFLIGDDEYLLRTEYGDILDQSLIKRNKKTKIETVVISSVKNAVPMLKERQNLLLSEFSHPENSQVLIFKSILSETDNPFGFLYSFDTTSQIFTEMKINKIYDGFFGGEILSPDQQKLVWVPDGIDGLAQTMYLIDLVTDSHKVVVKLSGSETFNGGRGAMSSEFPVIWINNSKVQYTIFDQAKKGENFDPFSESQKKAIFIGNREFSL